jgi:hypothetical protein
MVVLNEVKPRLIEMHKSAKNECKDSSPIATTETYQCLPKSVSNESHPFGNIMTFHIKMPVVWIFDSR